MEGINLESGRERQGKGILPWALYLSKLRGWRHVPSFPLECAEIIVQICFLGTISMSQHPALCSLFSLLQLSLREAVPDIERGCRKAKSWGPMSRGR